ncbi:MAG: molybdopterin-guanine dinucleotide biosynthesis protein B [bacterium]
MLKRLHIIGHHNSGKTTLLLKMAPALKSRGLRVGILKHVPNARDFEGKSDTAQFAKTGADLIVLAGDKGGAIYLSEPTSIEEWDTILAAMFPDVDLLLVEGYKSSKAAKIEVWYEDLPEPPLSEHQEAPLIFVSHVARLPNVLTLAPDDMDSIAARIYAWWSS